MANRPRVSGWENINQNKPAEYSSEFTVDGNRYANVTNVSTGQRQLYLVSGLGGTAFTQRSLITSTNTDGTVTKGEAYNSFINQYGANKLNNAERENKKQSLFIIEKASTQSEKSQLGNTNEYRSLANKSDETSDNENSLLRRIVLDTKNISKKSPLKGKPFVTYPIDIAQTKQDRIKFTAVTLKERNLSTPTEYEKIGDVADVYISIPGNISDQNAVVWGEEDLGLGKLAMAEIAGGGGEQAKKLLTSALNEVNTDQNTKNVAIQAAAAGEMSIFTRATQKVLNPNIELLFNKPSLRSFTFNFKMSARNQEEATAIKEIISFFKYHSAVKDVEGFLFLQSPDVFWIEYQKGKDTHQSLNLISPGKVKSKACALQSMSVNYTPLGSYMTYDDEQATMVQYDISLSFQDITPVYQSDYDLVKDHPIGY